MCWRAVLVTNLWPFLLGAAPLQDLSADLDGDGKPEKVIVQTLAEPKPSCSVTVGAVRYSAEDRWATAAPGRSSTWTAATP